MDTHDKHPGELAEQHVAANVWPRNMLVDRLHPESLTGLAIPLDAYRALTVTGLPRNIPAEGDTVTRFTSAIGEGNLSLFTPTLADERVRAFIASHIAEVEPLYLLGTKQSADLETPYNIAAHCLNVKTGEVLYIYLVPSTDIVDGICMHISNTSLPQFLDCLSVYHECFVMRVALNDEVYKGNTTRAKRLVAHCRRELQRRDPHVFDDPNRFWLTLIEEMSEEL